MKMNWIESTGGPLIAVPVSVIHLWRGADLEHPMVGDDYSRACAVDGYCGLISVGNQQALVLGDEPNSATYFHADADPSLLRWVYADSEAHLIEVALEGECGEKPDEILHFDMLAERLVLIDSANSGRNFGELLEFPLDPGTYRIETRYSKSKNAAAITHVFKRCDSAHRGLNQ